MALVQKPVSEIEAECTFKTSIFGNDNTCGKDASSVVVDPRDDSKHSRCHGHEGMVNYDLYGVVEYHVMVDTDVHQGP